MYACQSEEGEDIFFPDLPDGIFKIFAPDDVFFITWRINTFESDDKQVQGMGYFLYGLVQLYGKGVGGVYQSLNVMFLSLIHISEPTRH